MSVSHPGGGAEGGRTSQLPPNPPASALAVRGTGGRLGEKEGMEGFQPVRAGPRGHRPPIRPPAVPLTLSRGRRVWTQALLRWCPQATPLKQPRPPGRGATSMPGEVVGRRASPREPQAPAFFG